MGCRVGCTGHSAHRSHCRSSAFCRYGWHATIALGPKRGPAGASVGCCREGVNSHLLAVLQSDDSRSVHIVGKRDHIRHKTFFVSTSHGHFALSGSVLRPTAASLALRDFQFSSNSINAGTTTSGAQKFPLAASAKISVSSVRSETALHSRSFSFC